MYKRSNIVFALAAALLVAASTRVVAQSHQTTANPDDQICDPIADYYLGMEDYPMAVKLHQAVIRKHPDLALAHYHLGFAQGEMGDHQSELLDYQKAVDLGLSDWELFLNLGRLYLETGHIDQASDVFRLATLLAPYRPETHYNLGLVYERLGALTQAEQEILLSLRLSLIKWRRATPSESSTLRRAIMLERSGSGRNSAAPILTTRPPVLTWLSFNASSVVKSRAQSD